MARTPSAICVHPSFPPVLLAVLCLFALPATAQPPAVAIVAPAVDQHVQGLITVLASTAPGDSLRSLYVGLDKACWAEMKQTETPGEWTGCLDSALVPSGRRLLEVVTDNREVRTEIEINVQNPLKVFFSDLHSHTSYSDGTLVPSAAYRYGREIAGLDVFCVTDHLEMTDDTEWLDSREAAWKANQDGRFVAFPGLEWTKEWGHINLFDPQSRRWPVDPDEFYEACAKARVVAKFNHPGDGTVSHAGLKYSEIGDQAVQLMEVRNPEEEQAYIRALDLGWHVAPDGSDDTHEANWGTAFAYSGILAPGLSKRNILDALSKRHCYSTLDRNCILFFQINDAVMGDIIEPPLRSACIQVSIDDPDAGDLASTIELYEDGRVVETNRPNLEKHRWETIRSPSPGSHYYFVKVIQRDGNHLWSAPVWITVAEP